MANEIEKRNETFLIYQDENGIARVNVRFEGEDVWLTVEQIMELFDASQQDVSYHIKQIYADGEQDAERTHKKFLLVRQEGNRSVRRNMSHYNLDMIIAVGYRVKSQVATRFRQWATMRLREFSCGCIISILFVITCTSSSALSRQRSSLTCQSHLNWRKDGKEKMTHHNAKQSVKPLRIRLSTAI